MRIVQDVRHGVSVQLSAAEVAELGQGLVARDCMEKLSATFPLHAGLIQAAMRPIAEEVEARQKLQRDLMYYAAISRMKRMEVDWGQRVWDALVTVFGVRSQKEGEG